jgi:hypothetical protein
MPRVEDGLNEIDLLGGGTEPPAPPPFPCQSRPGQTDMGLTHKPTLSVR